MNLYGLVSVIVPVYKVETKIRDCLDSLLNQDYLNYEIILIDDGSPDLSGKICDEYAKKNDKIFVIHQKNAGVSAARNTGLCKAKGDYVVFVDPDDWVEPNYISLLVTYMRPGGMAVCLLIRESYDAQPQTITMSSQKEKIYSCMTRVQAELSLFEQDGIGCYACAKIFDRKVLIQYNIIFDQEITISEDLLFVLQYLSFIKKEIVFIKTKAYHYRMNPNSATMTCFQKDNFDSKILNYCKALDLAEKYIDKSDILTNKLRAHQMRAKARFLLILQLKGKKNHMIYMNSLRDMRKRLRYYLFYCKDEPIKEKLIILFCCISPELEYILWKVNRLMKKDMK